MNFRRADLSAPSAQVRTLNESRDGDGIMSPASALPKIQIEQRIAGDNVWLHDRTTDSEQELMACVSQALNYEVLESEEAVGQAMFAELLGAAEATSDNLTVVI